MELRWILILAGIGIFVFLYFSGRPKKRRPIGQAGAGTAAGEGSSMDPYGGSLDAGHGGSSSAYPPTDPYAQQSGNSHDGYGQSPYDPHTGSGGASGQSPYANHPAVQHDHRVDGSQPAPTPEAYANHGMGHPIDADPLMDSSAQAEAMTPFRQQPGVHAVGGDSGGRMGVEAGSSHLGDQPPYADQAFDGQHNPAPRSEAAATFDLDPNDMQRPADAQWSGGNEAPPSYPDAHNAPGSLDGNVTSANHPGQSAAQAPATRGSGFGGFLSQLSGGLIGKSRSGVTPTGPDGQSLYASHGVDPFLITLHIVAPEGQIIHGPRLQALFEQRGYHFGEMNIFHSLNQGSIVFSIAKLIEPGTFDVNDPASFETPGITMILQLPAPIAADVAFEVLISEASELATALGCSILDGDHSTLSRQTIQHLRDNVHQFMHRQRLAETVPS